MLRSDERNPILLRKKILLRCKGKKYLEEEDARVIGLDRLARVKMVKKTKNVGQGTNHHEQRKKAQGKKGQGKRDNEKRAKKKGQGKRANEKGTSEKGQEKGTREKGQGKRAKMKRAKEKSRRSR